MNLDDATLHAVVAELRAKRRRVGIPTIRKTLSERFGGHSAGTDRLRAILAEQRKNVVSPALTSPQPKSTNAWLLDRYRTARTVAKQLRRRLREALDRARRAEESEMEAARHWAQKVDQLRQEILRLKGPSNDTPPVGSPRWLDLYRELQATRARLEKLENSDVPKNTDRKDSAQ